MNLSLTYCPDRLILRMPKLSDLECWAGFFAFDRSIHKRGRRDHVEAWQTWATGVALRSLRGCGAFGFDGRRSGDYTGEAGIRQELRAQA